MYYKQFLKTLTEADETIRSYGQLIEKTKEGTILIDGCNLGHKTLEEARKYVKEYHDKIQLAGKIAKDTYQEISENTVASIIKEHHDIKVTDTLIETYIDLASSKIFTIDPVVHKIRSLNKLDEVIENKLHYKLNDDAIVAINETTQEQLNNILADQKEIVDYMRESKENFFYVIDKIKE